MVGLLRGGSWGLDGKGGGYPSCFQHAPHLFHPPRLRIKTTEWVTPITQPGELRPREGAKVAQVGSETAEPSRHAASGERSGFKSWPCSVQEKTRDLSEPQFLHLYNGVNQNIYLRAIVRQCVKTCF